MKGTLQRFAISVCIGGAMAILSSFTLYRNISSFLQCTDSVFRAQTQDIRTELNLLLEVNEKNLPDVERLLNEPKLNPDSMSVFLVVDSSRSFRLPKALQVRKNTYWTFKLCDRSNIGNLFFEKNGLVQGKIREFDFENVDKFITLWRKSQRKPVIRK